MVPAALRRCGRFADGWLPSSCTPEEVVAARAVIDQAAADAGRAISPGAFRGVAGLRGPAPRSHGRSRPCRPPARGSIPNRWCRWGSAGCGPCSNGSSTWGSPSSWSGRWRRPDPWRQRARGPGPRRARPPDVTRAPTRRVGVRGAGRSRAAGAHGRAGRPGEPAGSTSSPIIEEEYEPAPPGALRLPRRVDPQGDHRHLDARQAPGRRRGQADHRRAPTRRRAPRGASPTRARAAPARRLADHPGPPPAGPGRRGARRGATTDR